MKKIQNISLIGAVVHGIVFISAVVLSGCDDNNRILEPAQVGRFRPVPAVNVILDSLGVEEETPPAWADAVDPVPEDGVAEEGDYTFDSGDVVRVSIYELIDEGKAFENDFYVDETGNVNIIQIGIVHVAGLTERQLEEELRNVLQPNILKEPLVTVTLMRSQKKMFSITGSGVRNSSRYNIPRYDFRLLDAIAQAGGMSQFNVSYVYVSRPIKEEAQADTSAGLDVTNGGQENNELITPEQNMLKMLMPVQKQQQQANDKRVIMTPSEMATQDELVKTASPEGIDILNQIAEIPTRVAEQTGKVEWIFKDGKYVAVPVAEEGKTAQPFQRVEQLTAEKQTPAAAAKGAKTRLIKIPVEKLVAGDPQYNIVVKSGDVINVPVDMIGEFWVMGNVVSKQGIFEITGRPLTLKMAIAAAGGLAPTAWPKHCEVTRRIGKDKEETVMVDFDKIARGEQPDFFIKPNDLINVGTHPTSMFRYKLLNAFSPTYGFYLVYTRYFTERNFGLNNPLGPFGL
jgi:polysaccharide biosynthesis/export protein